METIKTDSNKKENFRVMLERELSRRSKKNPSYSLRSFAKSLDMDASLLSKLLSGKRPINDGHILKLGPKLGLSLRGLKKFQEGSNDKISAAFKPLSLDQYDLISEWEHYAILELVSLKSFKPCLKWVATQLKSTTNKVRACVKRLERSGLLKIEEDGSWVDISSGYSTHILGENITTEAHKASQKEILKKAIKSIDDIDFKKRDQSSMMLSTSPEKIIKAKKMITKFRRELTYFLEDTEDKTAVYQLSVSLFPLINIKEEKGESHE